MFTEDIPDPTSDCAAAPFNNSEHKWYSGSPAIPTNKVSSTVESDNLSALPNKAKIWPARPIAEAVINDAFKSVFTINVESLERHTLEKLPEGFEVLKSWITGMLSSEVTTTKGMVGSVVLSCT